MKVFVIALLIFSLLSTGIFFNVFYLTNVIGDIRESISAIPTPPEGEKDLSRQANSLQEIRDRWNDKNGYISLTVNHADLMEAETQFAAAIGAAKAGTRENYLVAVAQLDYALSHLSDMAQVSLKNII